MPLFTAQMSEERKKELRNEYVRTIIPMERFSSCNMLVRDDSKLRNSGDSRFTEKYTYKSNLPEITYVDRYLDMDAFIKTLSNGLLFKEIKQWNDPYEKRFYTDEKMTKYKGGLNQYTPRMYACCFTLGEESEIRWKAYSQKEGLGARCVKVRFDLELLLSLLDISAKKYNFTVY